MLFFSSGYKGFWNCIQIQYLSLARAIQNGVRIKYLDTLLRILMESEVFLWHLMVLNALIKSSHGHKVRMRFVFDLPPLKVNFLPLPLHHKHIEHDVFCQYTYIYESEV